MAVPLPVTKTIISTTNWGIPITNEVNRLTPIVDALNLPATATKQLTSGTFFNIDATTKFVTGMEVVMPARPGHVFMLTAMGDFFSTDAACAYNAFIKSGPNPGTNTEASSGSIRTLIANFAFNFWIVKLIPAPATAQTYGLYATRTSGATVGAMSSGAQISVIDLGVAVAGYAPPPS